MAIEFTPSVGLVLECNYGNYIEVRGRETVNFDELQPPEMRKKRLVVVINGRINGGSCIFVPLSTTKDNNKVLRKYHIEVEEQLIPPLENFSQQTRWAKADMVQQVSKLRLFRPREYRGFSDINLPSELIEEIQRSIIRSMNATRLIKPPSEPTPATPPEGAPNAEPTPALTVTNGDNGAS